MQKIVPPDKIELENLLFNQMMSKKKIAAHYSVCKKTLNTWMRQYGLVNKIPIELQKAKRERTNMLKTKALQGEEVNVPGFNSEFIEEYMIEIESEKARRQENYLKRVRIEKARREVKRARRKEVMNS